MGLSLIPEYLTVTCRSWNASICSFAYHLRYFYAPSLPQKSPLKSYAPHRLHCIKKQYKLRTNSLLFWRRYVRWVGVRQTECWRINRCREIILNELTKRVHRIFPTAEVKVKPMQANGLNSDASKSDQKKLNWIAMDNFNVTATFL